MIDINKQVTQKEFGELVGISQPAVSDLLAKQIISEGVSVGQWLREYCGNLREVAAGRLSRGDIGLATERAALARVQRERVEMQNAISRGQLVPATLIEPRLRAVVIAAREFLRAQPLRLAQQAQGMSVDDLAQLLSESFDLFLEKLSRMPVITNDDDQDELDSDESIPV